MTPAEIGQFFVRMAHLYGHRWTGQYGSGASESGELTISARQWAADLAGFTQAQIRTAIDISERQHLEWPPTVPQFKALCRGVPSGQGPDPRLIALQKANEAFQVVLTDAKLGLLAGRARGDGYDQATMVAIEAVGGFSAVLAADPNRRNELGPQFVRAHMGQALEVAA